ncbi:MAG: class I SAM-dependent methyltransferase [Methanospirillum sp.]|uniref:class I SAM-dependent methyltransferase n=1 Tax=Methanospirillum sp. TaxID=45200 RepID=UPI0023761E90|nr:class I SAM-dependent methyltransferase [Methanospirillum sp.]MDD1728391.1 class I SAM-dependent methyltransferase [Methanospirillum sp.]
MTTSDHPNPLTPSSQRQSWDERYHEKGRQWGNAPAEFIQDQLIGTILELGVGDGKNVRTRNLSDRCCIGVDFSPAALRICQGDPVLSDLHLVQSDACYLPFHNSSVDHVYAHHILGHLSLYLQPVLMDEIWRVLKPQGSLALTVFAQGDMRDGQGEEIEPGTYLRGDGIITRYFSPDDIRVLGFRFLIGKIIREEWILRIRGKSHRRAVLTVVLEKQLRTI